MTRFINDPEDPEGITAISPGSLREQRTRGYVRNNSFDPEGVAAVLAPAKALRPLRGRFPSTARTPGAPLRDDPGLMAVILPGSRTSLAWRVGAMLLFISLPMLLRADEPNSPAKSDSPFELQTHRGKVVYLAEALQRLHNIKSVDEAKERVLAVETKDGTLIPLVEDVRGRAFRADKRLREMQVELLLRKFKGSPAGQVIRIYELTKEGKFEIDYWCDICSIAMYELKVCECCQGEIELRRTKVIEEKRSAE